MVLLRMYPGTEDQIEKIASSVTVEEQLIRTAEATTALSTACINMERAWRTETGAGFLDAAEKIMEIAAGAAMQLEVILQMLDFTPEELDAEIRKRLEATE